MNFISKIGKQVTTWLTIVFEFTKLLLEALYWIIFGTFRKKPVNLKSTFEQMAFMGVESVVIVFFCVFLPGLY